MNKTLGILGGGQLARMLALSAHNLGIKVKCIDSDSDCPASLLTDFKAVSFDKLDVIGDFFSDVTSLTYEFENIPYDVIQNLSNQFSIYPGLKAILTTQSRIREKTFCKDLGVKVPKFLEFNTAKELLDRKSELFFPSVLKTSSGGYDGKGQWKLSSYDDLVSKLSSIPDTELILEEFITFDKEYSCIAVRSLKNEIKFYPLCENIHQNGILFKTISPPVNLDLKIQEKIKNYTSKILEALSYVGVLTVEYFIKGDEVYFNEYAPRVHNSGHWTIEGSICSQFENHVRACLGLPLGETSSVGFSSMYNLLGTRGDLESLLSIPKVHYHWYGKKDILPLRKLGHVTIISLNEEERNKIESSILELLK